MKTYVEVDKFFDVKLLLCAFVQVLLIYSNMEVYKGLQDKIQHFKLLVDTLENKLGAVCQMKL